MAPSRSSSKFRPLAGVRPRPRRGRPHSGRRRRRRVARQVSLSRGSRLAFAPAPGSDDPHHHLRPGVAHQGHGDGPVLVEHATRGAFSLLDPVERHLPEMAGSEAGRTPIHRLSPTPPASSPTIRCRTMPGKARALLGDRAGAARRAPRLALHLQRRGLRAGAGWPSGARRRLDVLADELLFQPLRFRDTRSARGGRTAAASRRPSEPTGAGCAAPSTIRARGRGRSRESAGMRGCSGRRARWRASAR